LEVRIRISPRGVLEGFIFELSSYDPDACEDMTEDQEDDEEEEETFET